MKASKVLVNKAVEKDFRGRNLKGKSFKGEVLEGADFSGANIRGADFSDANLENTKFVEANAGLQTRWLFGLAFSLLVISILSSLLPLVMTGEIVYVFKEFYNTDAIFITIISALFIALVLFVAIWKGLLSASVASVAIVIFTIFIAWILGANAADARINAISAAVIGILVVGTITAVVTTGIFAFIGAATFSISGRLIFLLIGVITCICGVWIASAAYQVTVAVTVNAAAIGVFVLSGAYLGWRILNGDKRDAWIRRIAIAFAAIGGTSFRGANLTDAYFAGATLKNTDFREAILIRTYFHKTKKLDLVRPGNTYLRKSEVRQLVMTKKRRNVNFDRFDLRGVNLQEASLENASFIDANFYQANLQGADLSRTKLIRTNLERADLRGANLTGSCIQDWVITESTKLNGIACDYVYLRWIDGDKRDQMPPRGKFKEGGFVTFVRYILETVELYHEKDINPRLALTVLQKMSKDYDEPLDIVALGKRGERVFIQVKVSENITRENFKEDYYSRYDTDLKLWSGNIHQLPPAVDSLIEKRISKIASERADDFVFIDVAHVEGNYTEIYQESTTVTGDRNIQTGRDYRETHVNDQGTYVEGDYRTIQTGGGNYNESIAGDYIQGNKVDTMNSGFSVGGSVGGDINNVQGDNNRAVQGDNNQAVQGDNNQIGIDTEAPVSKDDIVKLLEELEALVLKAQLPQETKEEVSEDISAAKKATNKDEPKKNIALANLESVAQTLEKTNKTVDASQKLWSKAKPIITKIAGWLGAAAGSYLLNL
ncbi:MAG: pentapeptide repeat-containing protein [Cyanobacteria bacterium P01_H01_bin.150]